MTKVTEQKTGKNWKKLAAITVLLAVVYVAFSVIMMYISHPTQTHRDITRQNYELQSSMWSSMDSEESFEEYENKLDALAEKPEAQYIAKLQVVEIVASLAVSVVIIGLLYNYIRKNRLAGDATWATVITDVIATLISVAAIVPIYGLFYNYHQPLLEVVFMLIGAATLGLVFTYIVARIFQWRYDRKHSFVVE